MKPSSILYAIIFTLSSTTPLSHGIRLPFQKRIISAKIFANSPSFEATDITSLSAADGAEKGTNALGNVMDIRYTVTINLNGKDILVALDTGSTDLWVSPPGGIGPAKSLELPLDLKYGDGTYGVSGIIKSAPFELGSHKIPQQAFLDATTNTIGSMKDIGINGLLGLSFDMSVTSPINRLIKERYGPNSTIGRSVLKNIFANHPDQPNFIALDLARSDDLEDTTGGSFSIGEYQDEFAAVAKAPKLQQFPKDSAKWTTLLEGLYVEGKSIPLQSSIPSAPEGHISVLLDTGAPSNVMQTEVVDAIYSRIPGAVSIKAGLWIIPCNTETIVEFRFGGQKFPIHPLDLSNIKNVANPETGEKRVYCQSAFSGSTLDRFKSRPYETILGDSFLRNVYSVFDFGDDLPDGTVGEPYMQLLAETDPKKAKADVSIIRARTMANLPKEISPDELDSLSSGNSTSSTNHDGDEFGSSPPSTSTDTSIRTKPSNTVDSPLPGTGSDSASATTSAISKYGPIVVGLLAGNMIIGLILIVLAVMSWIRRGKLSNNTVSRTAPHYTPVRLKEEEAFPRTSTQGPYAPQ